MANEKQKSPRFGKQNRDFDSPRAYLRWFWPVAFIFSERLMRMVNRWCANATTRLAKWFPA
jgi:hypothetical protein